MRTRKQPQKTKKRQLWITRSNYLMTHYNLLKYNQKTFVKWFAEELEKGRAISKFSKKQKDWVVGLTVLVSDIRRGY